MNEEKTQIVDGVASTLNAELDTGDDIMQSEKLWAVNIPPEPDSILFYPVPSLEIAQELTERLKKEALERFKIMGDVIADSIYFEEWKGADQEHA